MRQSPVPRVPRNLIYLFDNSFRAIWPRPEPQIANNHHGSVQIEMNITQIVQKTKQESEKDVYFGVLFDLFRDRFQIVNIYMCMEGGGRLLCASKSSYRRELLGCLVFDNNNRETYLACG